MPEEPKTANVEQDKAMKELVKDPDFGTMENTKDKDIFEMNHEATQKAFNEGKD